MLGEGIECECNMSAKGKQISLQWAQGRHLAILLGNGNEISTSTSRKTSSYNSR